MAFKKKKFSQNSLSSFSALSGVATISDTKTETSAAITSESDNKKKKILKKKRKATKAYNKLVSEATEYEIASERILLETYSDGGALDEYLREQLKGFDPDTNPLTKEEAESIIRGLIDLACAERTRYMGEFVKICKEGNEAVGYRSRIEEIVTLECEAENAKSTKEKIAAELKEFKEEFEDFNSVEKKMRKADINEKLNKRDVAKLRKAEKCKEKEQMRQLRRELKQKKFEAKVSLKKARIQKKIDKAGGYGTGEVKNKGKNPPDEKRDDRSDGSDVTAIDKKLIFTPGDDT